ncbi:MAG: DUF4373 domain-containing protein [Eubacterium sp.]|nr:DUF4373 domain-containing protein [Eubacterium sp.]
MAAPFKNGLDYFTCDCFFDDKTELVIAEFGLKGLGVLVRLWQKIYSTEGYYCQWNEDVALMFASKNAVSVSAVSEIINACVRRGVFDCGMLERCGILTSRGIQKRYFEAVKRRTNQSVIGDYLLIDVPGVSVNVNNNAINVNNNGKNARSNQQSKVKESKVKESKVKESNKSPYGAFANVYLTEEEYAKITEQGLLEVLEELSEAIESKGYKYKSHYATILAWHRRNRQKQQSTKQQPPKGKMQRAPSFDIEAIKRDALLNEDYDI